MGSDVRIEETFGKVHPNYSYSFELCLSLYDPAGFDYWSPELFRMHGLDPDGKPPHCQTLPSDSLFESRLGR
jgi:hypothetical protein